ncbi:hypothetical protein C1J03_19415 [Sulfitobacter sp. SK012]|uniref:CRTAC1 family protein n=1 Tax=Sulfitobacter sp. SK012 TaxID=1389005 RepID=UPI000E0A41CD|nr:CRTAC1 family protein [Sulfitobacter sp. SK012]AXI48994.1 hypothetical protein C1J03_19415 [Sulfitobacter sp. SK012]
MFQDISDHLPRHVYSGGWEHFVGGGLAIFDCDGNALPDIFAAGGKNPASMLRNGGDMQFTAAPLLDIQGATGAYPLDMDADGIMDLFVLRVGANQLLKGGANCSFTDATAKWGIPTQDKWSTAFSAWWQDDLNGPVLAIGNYVDRTDVDGPFEACDDNAILWPGAGGYRFETLAPGFCPLSMLAAQDARGRTTLRISNDRHYYISGGYEQMWDVSERRFLTEDDGWKNVSLWGMGIASRDLTGDGLDEVMLTSMGDQLLQIAQADGTYANAPYEIGTYAQRPHIGDDGRPSTGWHAEFGDIDNDGRADLFIAKGNVDQMPGMATRDPNNLLMQNPDGHFVEASVGAGVASVKRSRGAGLADFDADGRLDLVVLNRRAPLELYRNVTADSGNWVRISLRQPGSNRDAIGGVIAVTTGESTQTMQHTIGGGHAGGQLLPRHFGLGEATQAEVKVHWPNGFSSIHQAKAGETLIITRP